jgi:hypothetical protein
MNLDEAIKSAQHLANCFDAKLDACLFADSLKDESWWGFAFEIIDGPQDWSWTVIISPNGKGSTLFATNSRPMAILRPRIRRRWWFFGPSKLRRPRNQSLQKT